MPDLRLSSVVGFSPPKTFEQGALSLTQNSDLALASLALRRGADEPRPFGLALPGPGAWAARGDVSAFWTGPEQWMLEAQGRAESDFAAEVMAACPGQSVSEQTDGFVAFEIRSQAGENPILGLMAKLMNIDPRLFVAGSATRTGFEHMSVFVIRREVRHLAVLGMRSAADALWHALQGRVQTLAEAGE